MDGLYVIRTTVLPETLSAERTVSAYKDLSQVEWAFRWLKSVDLKVRPIYHWKDGRVGLGFARIEGDADNWQGYNAWGGTNMSR